MIFTVTIRLDVFFRTLVKVVFSFILFTLDITAFFAVIFWFQMLVNAGYFEVVVIDVAAVLTSDKVPTVNVIDITVIIIVFPVAGNFIFIDPHDIFQIFVVVIYPRVNDRHNNGFALTVFQHGLVGFFDADALHVGFSG